MFLIKKKVLLLIFFTASSCLCFDPDMGMSAWIQTCKKLPKNRVEHGGKMQFRELKAEHPHDINDSAFGKDTMKARTGFSEVLVRTIKTMVLQLENSVWLGDVSPCVLQKSPNPGIKNGFPFAPFAQKLDLTPEDKIIMHGDMHGDCHSLVQELEKLQSEKILDDNFKIIPPKVYMAFLGDYVDWGRHGAEVMFTLFRLKLANPDEVFIVRGNHEDVEVCKDFIAECTKKFSRSGDSPALNTLLNNIAAFYETLPAVLYVGCGDNYLQCCHGGMEPGYNPSALLNNKVQCQLIGYLNRKAFLRSDLASNPYLQGDVRMDSDKYYNLDLTQPGGSRRAGLTDSLGFMWNEFLCTGNDTQDRNNFIRRNQGVLHFGRGATEELLDFYNNRSKKRVLGVMRAHQHAPQKTLMMQGIISSNGLYKLWEPVEISSERSLESGLVWTFPVAPDSRQGHGCRYSFHTYVILTVRTEYKDWRLKVVNIDPFLAESSDSSSGGVAANGGKSGGGGGSKPVAIENPRSADLESGGAQSTKSSALTPDRPMPRNPTENDNRWLLTRLMYWLLSRPKVLIYWLLSFISR
jgi:hypothetical protein